MARAAEAAVYHPGGLDAELRAAVDEVVAGHWMAMRDLLARTGADWARRTSRTQVLAVTAARSDLVRVWRAEEPDSYDALVMSARVAVERALLAHGHARGPHTSTAQLAATARRLCLAAAERHPRDPVPWVCLLALARTDARRERPEHRVPHGDVMLPPGPWRLLAHVDRLDPGNREAYHRALQFVRTCAGGTPAAGLEFVRWADSRAPEGSSLLVLPLYVYVENYWSGRRPGAVDVLRYIHWAAPGVAYHTRRALESWFDSPATAERSLLDLNHLAYALWSADRRADAGRVFRAMKRFRTPLPWAFEAPPGDSGAEVFAEARQACLRALDESGRA
ncbi:hypothetical protein GCM10027168_63040 [Streptomyces capparidis]